MNIPHFYYLRIVRDDHYYNLASDPTSADGDYVNLVEYFLEEFHIPDYECAVQVVKALQYRLPKITFIIKEI